MSLEHLCASMVQPTVLLPREHPQGGLVASYPLNPLYPLATGGTGSGSGCFGEKGSGSVCFGGQRFQQGRLQHSESARALTRCLCRDSASPNPRAARAAQQHVDL